MNGPTISVLMPVYNSDRYVDRAICSVLAQSWSDFEFLIVDDGSHDRSREVIERHAQSDRRIRVLGGAHRGITHALNLALESARGELLARMDADDICFPHRFAQQHAFLVQHSGVVAVGCYLQTIDEDGDPIATMKWPLDHASIARGLLCGKGGIPHPAAMMRRSSVLQVGGYRSEFRFAQDKDLWLRLMDIGELANLAQPLLQYREHLFNSGHLHGQEQAAAVASSVAEARARRGIEPAVGFRLDSAPTVAARRRHWIRAAARAGNLVTARKHARLLRQEDPWSWSTWWTLSRMLWFAQRKARFGKVQ